MTKKIDNVEPRGVPKEIQEKINDSQKSAQKAIKQGNGVCELVFILDKSGSMSGMEKDVIGGFNAMIEKQKKNPGKVYVSTVLFSTFCQVLHDRKPLEEIQPLTEEDYAVGGCTALLDALGDAIKHVRNIHKYARKEDVPQNTIFVITTDGFENASKNYSYSDIKKEIKKQEEQGWEFLFLAANIDAVATARSIGISEKRATNYRVEEDTAFMFNEVSETLSCYRESGVIKENWDKELKKKYNSKRK